MTALQWDQLRDRGPEIASGDSWTYLVAADDRNVVLTRYVTEYHGPGRHGREADAADVARQAALYAIQIGGAYEAVPEAAAGVTWHLKHAAQAYESGGDVTGQPAWRHEDQRAGPGKSAG